MSKRCAVFVFMLFPLAFAVFASDTLHVLEKGETLYSLSRKYAVPLALILERNNISDAGKIAAGQKIYIPETYTVQKGDTLYSIARTFSVSVDALAKINSLADAAVLKVGKILIIPEAAAEKRGSAAALQKQEQQQSSSAAWEDPRSYTKKAVDKNVRWPVPVKEIAYLSGKLSGVVIDSTSNAPVHAIASGTVISIGPHRGYGHVIFVQSKTKYVYVYAGLASILPKAGAQVTAGQELGSLAVDTVTGTPRLYFMVYANNKPIDPAKAPRGK